MYLSLSLSHCLGTVHLRERGWSAPCNTNFLAVFAQLPDLHNSFVNRVLKQCRQHVQMTLAGGATHSQSVKSKNNIFLRSGSLNLILLLAEINYSSVNPWGLRIYQMFVYSDSYFAGLICPLLSHYVEWCMIA